MAEMIQINKNQHSQLKRLAKANDSTIRSAASQLVQAAIKAGLHKDMKFVEAKKRGPKKGSKRKKAQAAEAAAAEAQPEQATETVSGEATEPTAEATEPEAETAAEAMPEA